MRSLARVTLLMLAIPMLVVGLWIEFLIILVRQDAKPGVDR